MYTTEADDPQTAVLTDYSRLDIESSMLEGEPCPITDELLDALLRVGSECGAQAQEEFGTENAEVVHASLTGNMREELIGPFTDGFGMGPSIFELDRQTKAFASEEL